MQLAGRVLATLFKWLFNFKILIYMWVFTLSNGISVIGNREQIAKWLNFFGDVYDDDVWDEFCSNFYYTEWIDEDEGPIIIALDPLVKKDNKEDDDDDLPF